MEWASKWRKSDIKNSSRLWTGKSIHFKTRFGKFTSRWRRSQRRRCGGSQTSSWLNMGLFTTSFISDILGTSWNQWPASWPTSTFSAPTTSSSWREGLGAWGKCTLTTSTSVSSQIWRSMEWTWKNTNSSWKSRSTLNWGSLCCPKAQTNSTTSSENPLHCWTPIDPLLCLNITQFPSILNLLTYGNFGESEPQKREKQPVEQWRWPFFSLLVQNDHL